MSSTQIGVLTATPDLLAQHLVLPLVARLRALHLTVAAAVPHVFTTAEAFMLYRGASTHPRTDTSRLYSQWLSPRMFTGGGSLVLLLRWNADDRPVQQVIRELKGKSDWKHPLPEQLRAISPLCDRSMSLIHSPDDEEGMAHELSLLFGPSMVASVASLAAAPVELHDRVLDAAFAPPNPDEGPLAALPRLLQRVAALFAADPQSGVGVEDVSTFLSAADGMRATLRASPPDLAEAVLWNGMTALAGAAAAISVRVHASPLLEHDVRGYRRACIRRVLARMVEQCCRDPHADPLLGELLAQALSDLGAPMGYWEQQQLYVTLAYHGRR
jgi:Nucleoside diphosphate kinase